GALGTTIAGDLSGTAEVDGRLGLLLQNPADSIVAERMGRDVAFGPENLGLERAEIWSRVDAALEAVGLSYGRDHFTAALSGGELQRLALAGVLALQPDVLLLDEPTSMLDAATATTVRAAILDAAGDRTMVVVEHRLGPWLDHVDRVIVVAPGAQIVFDGSVEDFRTGPPPAGIWMPGMATPRPLVVPTELVAPVGATNLVRATAVSVELATRTLRGTQRTLALDRFSAEVRPGELTAFTGPSGSGKSTALAVLGGLIKPSAGSVTPAFAGRRSRGLAIDVGWVPQNPEHGFLTSTVEQEVALTSGLVGRPVDVKAVLDVFGLEKYARTSPFRLSGGEQRQLALAAALAHRPSVALLDEPTVGQDPRTWAAVVGWMDAARRAGAAVAVSTHDADVPLDVEHRMEAGSVR
ncbi:MAG: ATP-binding cassette domain-containing protein, partial [Aeromicrobium sp.]|uniref:ATP-binding cassette domain-containing protein n=1 Tax=Aeromicrobium sp. TaxID=1871063 RepID=UPI003C4C0026